MVLSSVICPHCGSDNVFLHGHDENGKQRYRCENAECSHKTFLLKYKYNACDPKIKEKIYFETINGSGTRAISRALKISKDTVTKTLKSLETGDG